MWVHEGTGQAVAEHEPARRAGVSRRDLLRTAGLGAGLGAGIGAGVTVGGLVPAARAAAPAGPAAATADTSRHQVPFEGTHQHGIATRAQRHVVFATFDLAATSGPALARLLDTWTHAARRMTRGVAAGAPGVDVHGAGGHGSAPPDDAEAKGLGPARLTLTVGFGPRVFSRRFGLAGKSPDAFTPLPAFSTDALQRRWSGGDLAIQACADDVQVAVHAVRTLLHLAGGDAALRWVQQGFASRSAPHAAPRNLLGFPDGTASISGDDSAAMHEFVWVGSEGPAWLRAGSYLVVRRIAIDVPRWDDSSIGEQQRSVGRHKLDGRMLHPQPHRAHVRLASPALNGGARLLRRGYNFGGTSGDGTLDAGLLFLSYLRDIHAQFVPIQRRLAAHDHLNEYLRHVGSAVFVVPPGVSTGETWSTALFS